MRPVTTARLPPTTCPTAAFTQMDPSWVPGGQGGGLGREEHLPHFQMEPSSYLVPQMSVSTVT